MADSPSHDARLDIGPVLIRCACFPFEMASSMISSDLANAAGKLLDWEAELRFAGRRLSEELFRTVPEAPDRRTRTQLITLRRALYTSLEPVARNLLDSALHSSVLSACLKGNIVKHVNDRLEFVRERQQFEQLYQDVIIREKAELYSITSDEAFRKALYVASPSTLAALDRLPCATQKQRRRLEESLHSYLMRAIGRATPNGTWSGVAIEGQNGGNSRVIFSVWLDPFAAALKALARRDPWRSQIPLRVNPTLRRGAEHHFEFYHQGSWNSYQTLDPRLMEQFTTLLGKTQVFPDYLYEAKDLIDSGVLVPTLELPRIFEDSWDAIKKVIPLLPLSEQEIWRESLRILQNLAERLGLEYETAPVETLRSGMNSARCLVNLLLARYGVRPVPEDQHVFLADCRVALSSPLPSDLKVRSSRAIRSYWSFDRYGMGEVNASSERCFAFGELPEIGLTVEDLICRNASRTFPVDEIGYLQRWKCELAPVIHKCQHALSGNGTSPPIPPGSGLLRIDGTGQLRIGSITPDPCLFYSRFSALFRAADVDDPFFEWCSTGIQDAESAFPGLVFAEVGFSSPANLNAAARRKMTGRFLDMSQTDPETLRFYPDSTDWPKLRATGDTAAILPRLHSAALPDESDARTLAIRQFSFLIGRPNLVRPLPRFEEERESWHHLPRLMLDDVVVSPERWTPGEELVDILRLSSGSMRYLAWRTYARSVCLPDVVYVALDGSESEFLLHSDSALAIDLLGRRLAKFRGSLLIQEAWPSPLNSWLQDERGSHYAVELALAWHGDQDFWTQYLGCTKT